MSTTTPLECHVCHQQNGEHLPADGGPQTPQDGDISICFYCGSLSQFVVTEDSISTTPFTAEQEKELMQEPKIQQALAHLRAAQANRE